MQFEWDENKNVDNLQKHRLPLYMGAVAFDDPMQKEYYDETHSIYEDRYLLVGFAGTRPLMVTFTQPDPETIRLISVRKASKRELEDLYYGDC
jgi:uncharacterized DUF497 family protein